MSASARIRITRAAPLTTVQDDGRFGALSFGIAASGPMDAQGWDMAEGAGSGIEFTRAGLAFTLVSGETVAGFGGGGFTMTINRQAMDWPARLSLVAGDQVTITPGAWGMYGYVRFSGDIDVPEIIGSRATNTIAGLGGFDGKTLKAGDELGILPPAGNVEENSPQKMPVPSTAPFRFIWGLHADLFDQQTRRDFVSSSFFVSNRLDRMGVRLDDRTGVFSRSQHLSLVSDSVVPGDVQILGDGTPIVLMRDHQPTGGYPRIATLLREEVSRFAQTRPGTAIGFEPVSLMRAAALSGGRSR